MSSARNNNNNNTNDDINYHTPARAGKRSAAAAAAEAADVWEHTLKKHAKQDREEDEEFSMISHALVKQQDEYVKKAEFRRRKQIEDRHVAVRLIDIMQQANSKAAPEPVLNVYDTPLRKTGGTPAAVPSEILSTPRRLEMKKQQKQQSNLNVVAPSLSQDTIHEEEEYVSVSAPPVVSTTMRIRIQTFVIGDIIDGDGGTGGTMEKHVSSFDSTTTTGAIRGFAQVLDCSVVLLSQNNGGGGGKVVPVKYLKQLPVSNVAYLSSVWTGVLPQAKLAMTGEGLAPLDADEPIFSIVSRGPFLLGKGFSKFFLWKYVENSGTFSKVTAFAMQADGAHAILEDAVVGFDIDLPNKKFKAVLRKVPFTFADDVDGGSITVGEEAKVEDMLLDKGRVKVKMVDGPSGRLFLLGQKEVRKGCFYGHLFAEYEGKLVKLPGFADGQVQDLAGNDSHIFACTDDGKVYFLDHVGDMKKESVKWQEFLGSSHESMDLESIIACKGGCFGVEGSTAHFLFAGKDGSNNKIVKQSVAPEGAGVAFMDGSDSYASFLVWGTTTDDEAGSFDDSTAADDGHEVDDEEEGEEEDSKPAAKPTDAAAAAM